jgi:signal transduction histidine kinase
MVMKVLIVDDNASDRKLLRLIFERHGYKEIIEAGDGLDGLKNAKEWRPDLIISDALMPRMDGFQFLWTLKMVEELRNIPFIFYSAIYTGLKDEELALRLGAEGFINRPKEPDEFWQEMSAILEKIAAGRRKPHPPPLMEEERDLLRNYCEIVTGKLEEKVRELEETLARRKVAEEKLIANQERLKALAAELAHAEERERSRIAVELHDAVGQRLAQSEMMLGALTKIPISAECIGRIDEIRGILDTVIDQVRSLTFRISPPLLHLVGFEAAVESLCEKFQEDFGTRFTFMTDGEPRTIAEDLRGGLYRMVRELLFNAVKHARANTVAVSVKNVEIGVEIGVEDDGCGFDTSRLFQYRDKRICLGLSSIKERIEYLGGSMEIDSKPGHGTRVYLSVPV